MAPDPGLIRRVLAFLHAQSTNVCLADLESRFDCSFEPSVVDEERVIDHFHLASIRQFLQTGVDEYVMRLVQTISLIDGGCTDAGEEGILNVIKNRLASLLVRRMSNADFESEFQALVSDVRTMAHKRSLTRLANIKEGLSQLIKFCETGTALGAGACNIVLNPPNYLNFPPLASLRFIAFNLDAAAPLAGAAAETGLGDWISDYSAAAVYELNVASNTATYLSDRPVDWAGWHGLTTEARALAIPLPSFLTGDAIRIGPIHLEFGVASASNRVVFVLSQLVAAGMLRPLTISSTLLAGIFTRALSEVLFLQTRAAEVPAEAPAEVEADDSQSTVYSALGSGGGSTLNAVDLDDLPAVAEALRRDFCVLVLLRSSLPTSLIYSHPTTNARVGYSSSTQIARLCKRAKTAQVFAAQSDAAIRQCVSVAIKRLLHRLDNLDTLEPLLKDFPREEGDVAYIKLPKFCGNSQGLMLTARGLNLLRALLDSIITNMRGPDSAQFCDAYFTSRSSKSYAKRRCDAAEARPQPKQICFGVVHK